MTVENEVVEKLKQYCYEHGLDFENLAEVLNEPKVVPMVRGIGYEYVVISYLKNLLQNDTRFVAGKTIVNTQMDVKGSDADIFDKVTNRKIRLECKLAANGSFSTGTRIIKYPHCKIKVMRSRTLGEKMIERVAAMGEATIDEITAHKDSYLPSHFDFVITNLRNAFYVTTESDTFKFEPTDEQWAFLETFFNTTSHQVIDDELKFNHFYIKSTDLAPLNNGHDCNRRDCPNPTTCKFIPNYPIFRMNAPMNWKPLRDIRNDLI